MIKVVGQALGEYGEQLVAEKRKSGGCAPM
jgi:hypothetical protein